MIRVAIITDEGIGQKLGVGTHITNLVQSILEQDGKRNSYALVHRKREGHPMYRMAEDLVLPYASIPPFSTMRNFIALPLALRRFDFDIVHHPSNIGPFVFRRFMPVRKGKGKTVETLHDIIPSLFPDLYEPSVRWACAHLLPRIVKNVDRIITVSETSKRDIVSFFKVDEEKVTVIYNGANGMFRPASREQVRRVKAKYGLGDYLLFVGALEAKKNLPLLIQAFDRLKARGCPHRLLLVGKRGWGYDAIARAIRGSRSRADILQPGYVPAGELPALYTGASASVFPSVYEGFCIPALEAMSCGSPVVASNAGALPEIVGKAGIIVSQEEAALSGALVRVVEDSSLARRLRSAGLARSRKFSWEKAARQTIRVYEELFHG